LFHQGILDYLALARASGKERTSEIVLQVIAELARRDGKQWADKFGSTLEGLKKVRDDWSEGSAMKIEPGPWRRTSIELQCDQVRICGALQGVGAC
jgi:hypothetical protein